VVRTSVVFLLAATVALFLWGARKQFQRNGDMTRTDQSAYMDYAKASRTAPFGHVPTRIYMPIYPGVMSWFCREGDSDADFFQRGKCVNIGIALLTLALVYGVLLKNNHLWDATVAVSAAALAMVVFKAPCFQPELLFFAVSFLMFVAQLHLILRPSWPAAAVAGILSALAYLTKASVPPMIALTILCLIGRSVETWVRRRAGESGPAPAASRPGLGKAPWAAVLVFSAAALITASPFLRASKEMYGRWICEPNSHFFWCDSWPECQALMASAGGESGIYKMPASQLPGPATYWRTHTLSDAGARLAEGFRRLYQQHIQWGYGYARFIMVYGLCLGLIAWQRRKDVRAWLAGDGNKWALLYSCGLFAGYLLLCAWYTYIDNSRRYTLILFYPALYLSVKGLAAARNAEVEWHLFGSKLKASAVSSIVLLILLQYVIFAFFYRVQFMDGTY
jgi:hypothetical protein